jgi:hypothetical protein
MAAPVPFCTPAASIVALARTSIRRPAAFKFSTILAAAAID